MGLLIVLGLASSNQCNAAACIHTTVASYRVQYGSYVCHKGKATVVANLATINMQQISPSASRHTSTWLPSLSTKLATLPPTHWRPS